MATPFFQGSICSSWFSVETMKIEYTLAWVAFEKKEVLTNLDFFNPGGKLSLFMS